MNENSDALKVTRRRLLKVTAAMAVLAPHAVRSSFAQEGLGPFMAHDGLVIQTAWGNAYGPDAESWLKFSNVTADTAQIDYSSSRGMKAVRIMRAADRAAGRTLVLGFNAAMPKVIPNTTTFGVSTAVLNELRDTGKAQLALIPDTSLQKMQGQLTLAEKSKMTVAIGNDQVPVPVVHATAKFQAGARVAQGDIWVLDNQNNPMLLEYSLSFTNEKVPRHERVTLVTPGAAMQGEMEQALDTMREYTTRGIHFDFDKASIQPTSDGLLDEIARTLKNNPLWTLSITGYTDSIGDPGYNQKLSQKRAGSVKAAIVRRGIAPERLTTAGGGASNPVASNKTLQGRALNRRVVLKRTDR